MTISYTENFNWPLLDDAGENWGAVFNAVLEDLDIEVKAAQSPIILTSGEVVVSMRLHEIVLKHYQH